MIKFKSTSNAVYPKQNQFWFGEPGGGWIDVSCGKINSTTIKSTASDVCGNLNVTGSIYLNGVAVTAGGGGGGGVLSGTAVSITDLSFNTIVGYQALNSLTIGSENVALGYQALKSNTSGYSNVTNGYKSLYSNTTGYYNVANGYQSLYTNTSGYLGTAIGNNALFSNTTGSQNTAIGGGALYSNINGSDNIAIGVNSLRSNTSGNGNTANGSLALYSNTTGYGNIANGYQSLYFNTIGDNNVANGLQALYSNTTGSNNIGFGQYALQNLVGSGNIGIGNKTGVYLSSGNDNITIGDSTNNTLTNQPLSNVVTIGKNIQLDTSGSGMIKLKSTINTMYPKQNQFWFGEPDGGWIDVRANSITTSYINTSGDVSGSRLTYGSQNMYSTLITPTTFALPFDWNNGSVYDISCNFTDNIASIVTLTNMPIINNVLHTLTLIYKNNNCSSISINTINGDVIGISQTLNLLPNVTSIILFKLRYTNNTGSYVWASYPRLL
jgi:hypothetical protein